MTHPTSTESCWAAADLRLERLPLAVNASCDVCIIGAGIAGVLCAHAFAKRGLRPVVLDDGPIGGGETGRTTAHLSNAIDDRYYHIESALGAEAASICAESHSAAIDLIERIVLEERIDCGFRRVPGYLFLPPGEKEELLHRELRAAIRAGLRGVEWAPKAPSFESGPCLRFPDQAQFHPLRFLAGVAEAVEQRGGAIHTGARATRIENGPRLVVHTVSGREVSARTVVVATNTPFNDLVSMHTKQTAHRTYALSARVPRGLIAPALHWDTSERAGDTQGPYHYVRVQPGETPNEADLLVVGGGDHHTGDPGAEPDAWDALEIWARERWPAMGPVERRWSGQVMEPHDGVAFIGANPSGPEGVFVITGDSGMGMTHAGIAAILIPDLVESGQSPWRALYDPARKPTAAIREFAGENARALSRYADWLTPGADLDEIAPGEGGVLRRGLRLLAVHRDERGRLHARSAVCPHLGCVVQWNTVERSWDCPCHGSRFARDGRLLNGPASKDLEERPI